MSARPLLGVLGGSFNPPHVGHLAIASDAHAQLALERVLFVPAGAPPHKQIGGGAEPAARLEMTSLAVAGDERFAVSAVEIEQRLSFSVDTLMALRAAHPDHDLVFVVGSDSLLQFHAWHHPEEVARLATLAIAPRPGDDRAAVVAEAARWGATVMASAEIAVSSSDIRARLRAGRPVRYLVPEAVETYIREHGLYAT
jgi:nicotinate-nucleotide adenylyltransferase